MKKFAIILTAFVCLFAQGQTHYPIKNFLRSNAYGWDFISHYSWSNFTNVTNRKQEAIAQMGLTGLRVSSDAYANKDSANKVYLFNPEKRGFQTDSGMVLLRKRIPNLTIDFCYQNQPYNIQAEYAAAGVKSTVYRHYGSDPNLSSSYSEIAHDCLVLASRGGTNANVPDYPLFQSQYWWEPKQVMYKGAGFYNIIEPGNEWDNQYSNVNATTGLYDDKTPAYTGAQYAAAWSAVYDSVKKADPNMLVSTTGIANGNPQIMTDAINWCKTNRAGQLPFDIWQQHHYPWGWPLKGGLPGELSIIPEIQKVKAACPSCLYSVGEWSWDVNPNSPINAPAHDGYSAEQTRGQVAVRTIFKFSQIGVHDAYWFRLYTDYDPNIDADENPFATSSLLKQLDDSCHIVRTTVGDYFMQTSAFGDYVFSKVVRDDSVQVLKFTKQGAADLYIMWTVERITKYTDAQGVTHPVWNERKYNYNFNAAGTRYDLNDDSSGVLKSQPFYGGSVQLSSKPVFITTFSILPIRDTTGQIPRVVKGIKYHAKVVRLMDGKITNDYTNRYIELEELKKLIPSNQFLVIDYWTDKSDHQHLKIYKQ